MFLGLRLIILGDDFGNISIICTYYIAYTLYKAYKKKVKPRIIMHGLLSSVVLLEKPFCVNPSKTVIPFLNDIHAGLVLEPKNTLKIPSKIVMTVFFFLFSNVQLVFLSKISFNCSGYVFLPRKKTKVSLILKDIRNLSMQKFTNALPVICTCSFH